MKYFLPAIQCTTVRLRGATNTCQPLYSILQTKMDHRSPSHTKKTLFDFFFFFFFFAFLLKNCASLKIDAHQILSDLTRISRVAHFRNFPYKVRKFPRRPEI